jgi:ABC transporter DrrB family efflux protein
MLTAVAREPRGGLVQFARDGLLVGQRNLRRVPRVPQLLAVATIQPLLFVLLFAYILGGAITVPGGYRSYLLAGIFVQTVVFASATTATALAEDMSKGLIDRFRSLPMTRSAVLLGRALSDVVMNILTVAVLILVGLLVGWRIENGILKAIAGFGMLLLLGFAMSWLGAFIGLLIRAPEAVQSGMLILLFPVTFLSNALVPIQGMPGWLQPVAEWNPVSATGAALRQLFGNPNPFAAQHVWPAQHAILAALLWVAAILAVFGPLAVRRYRRSVA